MVSSLRTANMLRDYLSKMDPDAPAGRKGRKMMEEKLGMYLWWKTRLSKGAQSGRPPIPIPEALLNSRASVQDEESGLSAALRKKDRDRRDKAANRRRVRGGGHPLAESTRGKSKDTAMTLGEEAMRDEAENIAQLSEESHRPVVVITDDT
jgi:DNA excision repair protein ERCC-4